MSDDYESVPLAPHTALKCLPKAQYEALLAQRDALLNVMEEVDKLFTSFISPVGCDPAPDSTAGKVRSAIAMCKEETK